MCYSRVIYAKANLLCDDEPGRKRRRRWRLENIRKEMSRDGDVEATGYLGKEHVLLQSSI